MINKLLDAMVLRAKDEDDRCSIYNFLNEYDGLGFVDCNGSCSTCEINVISRIEKLRKEYKWYQVEKANGIKAIINEEQMAVDKNATVENYHKEEIIENMLSAMQEITTKEYGDCVIKQFVGSCGIETPSCATTSCSECKETSLNTFKQMLESLASDTQKQAISDKTSDNVNHPNHYNTNKYECIDEMIAVFGAEDVKAFCKCNAWKYRYRSNSKNGEEDLKKADWYLGKLMELQEKKND